MALRLDAHSTMPSKAEWLLILGFLVAILGGIANYFTLDPQQVAIVGFVGFVFVTLTKFLTTEPAPEPEPEPEPM